MAFANSVIGARSNREGGPSAIAAAVVGRTGRYGYHLDENRQANFVVEVRCPVKSVADLGAFELRRWAYKEEGIQGILHYQPTYHFTGLRKLGYAQDLCPNAERFFYKREFNLPMHPRLTDDDVEAMIQGIRSAAKKVRGR